MSIEAMKLALEALQFGLHVGFDESSERQIQKGGKAFDQHNQAITTLRQAIEQAQKQEPEFTAHVVETAYDWSEWVCPDPKSYLMKCCDCGLVHEAEFKVVRYKSEAEREDCKPVDDPNVQAVFRMRRSEQWTPEDMAHRAGGLPIEQAQKQEPVASSPIYFLRDNHTFKILSNDVSTALIEIEQEFNEGWTYGSLCSKRKGFAMIHASGDKTRLKFFAECKAALEAAHGIKE